MRGPFRTFRHEHCFELRGSDTVMIDRVEFDAPLGPVGRLVEQMVLARYLQELIRERGTFLKRLTEQRV